MKITIFTNLTAFESPGGAEIYLLNLMRYLKKYANEYNLTVDFYNPIKKNLSNYDIAIFYNSTAHSSLAYDFILLAKRKEKQVINIPVYYSLYYAFNFYEKVLFRLGTKFVSLYVKKFGNILRSKIEFFYTSLLLSDYILVSGVSEMNALINDFKIAKEKFKILPIAVEKRFYNCSPVFFKEKFGIDNFILYVGKIARRKNIHNLLKAYRYLNTDIPLVLIGNPDEPDYFSFIRNYINKYLSHRKILILPALPHSSKLLCSAYANAKVFVLPSFYETPGIAALEAALAGANIVITYYGTTKEYFGNYVYYVNPYDFKDISEKILLALNRPRENKELQEHILNNFTYEAVTLRFLKLLNEIYLIKPNQTTS